MSQKRTSNIGTSAKTTCEQAVAFFFLSFVKAANKKVRAVPPDLETIYGELFCNDLHQPTMILLPSHRLKQWGQPGEILGEVKVL